jgi:hypothetical protein
METIFDLMVGRKMLVKTDMKVDVELEIKEVKHETSTRQITPDTAANDWWGESETTHSYVVHVTNGSSKRFNNLEDIKLS